MGSGSSWYLEGVIESQSSTWRTAIDRSPFLIGRAEECQLRLDTPGISSHHAEIQIRPASQSTGDLGLDPAVLLRDLGSTNGTFVNYNRLKEPMALTEGDVIHFADQEFRLVSRSTNVPYQSTVALDLATIREAKESVRQGPELERMIETLEVINLFQPLIRMGDGSLFGFEMLGRGAVEGLPTSPVELLSAAARHGLELPLARAWRRQGARDARSLPGDAFLFFNSHPAELEDPEQLADSMAGLRSELPGVSVVLEIHEMSLTDTGAFRPLRERLVDLGVGLAFDDFGKGRSRLLELAELAPQYLKFDRSLIQDLDQAGRRRRELVGNLVGMVRDLGIETLAEGVETAAEAELCAELGFDYAQGYLYGRPQPIEAFRPVAEGVAESAEGAGGAVQ